MNLPILKKSEISGVTFGINVKVIEPVNMYECFLSDDVFIGPFVEIQKGVLIGRGSRIQSHTFICELVEIGISCFIGHGVMFINDQFKIGKPANGDKKLWKRTNVGNNVCIGTNSTILPVNICDNVVIGAGSVLTKDIQKSGIYAGNPCRFLRDF